MLFCNNIIINNLIFFYNSAFYVDVLLKPENNEHVKRLASLKHHLIMPREKLLVTSQLWQFKSCCIWRPLSDNGKEVLFFYKCGLMNNFYLLVLHVLNKE